MHTIPERLAQALAGKYRLERELGVGGTATVYLAEDIRHHRKVAIKVLKPQVAVALGPDRFEDEIRIAAGLHHPHILGMFDSGEADGFLYYVMPFVEGHSLRERLQRSDPIPFPYVAKLMSEIADALAHAHAAGIVHRDIKPENILIAGKHVVVTDFGIAKAISDAADRKSSTSLGTALGTPAYMAPEQASSEPDLDHRADIYALGVVGYEMLAGRTPFTGTAQQMLGAHLASKPQPVSELRPGIPPALAAVVMRALAKAPGDRWPSAEVMQAQLEPLATTTSTSGMVATAATVALAVRRKLPTRRIALGVAAVALVGVGAFAWQRMRVPDAAVPLAAVDAAVKPAAAASAIPDLATDSSIAVLPFQNMSSDAEQAYFSDGIAEELLNLLAKIPELRVVARTSSFMYRDGKTSIPEIGKALKVATVLEGSVRKNGNKVRITAQLIRASDGTQLWSETYDRTLEDVFKVQDEIASEVVDKLKLTLLAAAPKARPVDAAVYPLLLQADAMYLQGGPDGRRRATELYERIIKLRPGEARAWLGMSRSHLNTATSTGKGSAEKLRLSREAATKALALDPTLGLAHSYLAAVYAAQNDLPNAAREYELSYKLSPTEPRVIANLSNMLSQLGRHEEAMQGQRWYVSRDPASPKAQFNLCVYMLEGGAVEDAETACRTGLLLAPDYLYGHAMLAQVLLERGKLQESLKEARAEADPGSRLVQTAKALHGLGRHAESEQDLQNLMANYVPGYETSLADIYVYRGDADKAFVWLERALRSDDPQIVVVHTAPMFAKLHKDPRWLPFLRKMGKAPEQLAKIKFNPKLPG